MTKVKKSEKTRIHIIETTYECIAQYGHHKCTFELISDVSGYSQSRVVQVFKTRSNMFHVVNEHIWQQAILKTEAAVKSSLTEAPQKALKAYLEISIKHFLSDKNMPPFYMSFYNHCTFDAGIREFNLFLKENAQKRIEQLLKLYNPKLRNKKIKAQLIHNHLTGLLLNHAVDRDEKNTKALFREWTQNLYKELSRD